MPKIDLTTHGSAVGLLSMFTFIFLIATVFSYKCGASPEALQTLLAGAFGNFSGALLLALRGSSGKDDRERSGSPADRRGTDADPKPPEVK